MKTIKIDLQNGEQVCSARELYYFLEVGADFTHWCRRMFEYGFEEGKDFSSFLTESTGGRPSTDYALNLDCAKEISMLQRTEKGKQARQYFIACEKAAKSKTIDLTDPKAILQIAQNWADEQEKRIAAEKQVKELIPKGLFADAVTTSKDCILIGELAKLLKQNGVEIGQNRLFEILRNDGYLIKRSGTDYNMPTQKSMELELFQIKETVVVHAGGNTSISKTPKVTGKGQLYFVNKFSLKVSV
jgi:anti-repressor protein